MKPFLKFVGIGAACAGASLIPLPLLLLGGLGIAATQAAELDCDPVDTDLEPVTEEEAQSLLSFMQLIERAPDPKSAQALVEEFYL